MFVYPTSSSMLKKVTPHLLLIQFLLFVSSLSKAETFWVTSNENAGPNTLREALQKAAANGVAEKDSILFNLPVNTLADRTILLLSTLPAMTSNLVIDGTSQPGVGFGAGFAKVKLEMADVPQPYDRYNIPYMLEAKTADNIGVFGLFFHFSKWTLFTTSEICGGLKFIDCNKIRVGAAGKGNIFKGLWFGIMAGSDTYAVDGNVKFDSLTVQGNMVGYTENGDLAYVTGDYFNYTEYFLSAFRFSNVLIGGDNIEDGNIVAASSLEVKSSTPSMSGNIRIANNSFCVSSRRNPGLDSSQGDIKIDIRGQQLPVLIEKNIINGYIYLSELQKPFHIRGNLILNGYNYRSLFASRSLIQTNQCSGGGLIGGDNTGDPNELTSYYANTADPPTIGAPGYAIVTDDLYGQNISILKNKIHCVNSTGGGISAFWGNSISLNPLPPSFVRITSQTPTLITGKATPNSRIDVYYDDDCTACEGEIHLGTTTSAADSSWQFSGNFTKTVLATATNSKGATSEFTQPRFVNQEVKITHTRCNSNIGSIKGIKLYGNWDEVLWYKYDIDIQNGTIKMVPLATTLDIENLSEGTYYFRVKYKNTCVAPIGEYKIYNYEYYITDTYAQIKQPACNQPSGRISQVYVGSGNGSYADAIKYWEDDKGNRYPDEEISMMYASVSRLNPGNYRLILEDTIGLCSDTSRWFTLINQPGPAINETNVSIKNSTCNLPNGSIDGISIVNPGNNPFFAWLDSANKTVSNQIILSNSRIGKYRLAYWDDGGCDTLYSSWFRINAAGAIVMDTTKFVTTASQCIKPTGTIKGIVSYGNYSYTWLDAAGTTVSSTLDPGLVLPGKYMLKVSSGEGCDSVLGPFIVPTVPTFDYDPQLQVSYSPSTCGENNGSVTMLNHPSLPGYSYRWVASSTDNGPVLSTTFSLQNMTAGTSYYFFLKDSKGCEQLGFTAQNNVQFPKPTLNETALTVQPVTCVTKGSIAGLSVAQNPSAQPFQYLWRNQAGDSIANSINIGQLSVGSYTLKVTDQYNCSISKTFTIASAVLNLPAPAYTDLRIKRGSSASIVASNVQTGGSYSLFTSSTAVVSIQQNAIGRFNLGAINNDTTLFVQFEKDGCVSPRSIIRILVYDDISIIIPNAFSPNNDGINDIMTIKPQGIAALLKLSIFDRYGNMLYTSSDPQKGWNGQSKQVNVPAGMYYYILEAVSVENKRILKQGSVLLLR